MELVFFDQEEEEQEELPPLSAPPTLSITEEILDFINQSRTKEGFIDEVTRLYYYSYFIYKAL